VLHQFDVLREGVSEARSQWYAYPALFSGARLVDTVSSVLRRVARTRWRFTGSASSAAISSGGILK
jgi:hypothetical protein